MELKGKVALITGAASGIGESTALLFAKEGARVFLTDIDIEKGEKLAKKINEDGGEAVFFKADISKAQDSENSVIQAVKKFGKLDIAVNNAGVGGPQHPVGEYPVEGWDKVIAINLSGVFYGMRYQIPEMLKNGKGSIINVASILGSVGFANSAAYVAAKHGVVGLTKSAALEYSAKAIRVNSVGPAFINTPMLKDLDKDLLSQLVNAHPIGRLGEADEVAQLFLWLASEKSSFATGAYYPIDGGYLAQ
ncbi:MULTISPECIES: SDR family NAD(P)-dependent oxidoreductase [unclassified Salegentibacter]|jgi:NAD(P)-dependent dehydrogenase (short-subunit alcohol dehydrogenase family)|uniref:SDR family NAD(P)-dependent oxidoreductase n=1 Tax=unclassified Salegentibacter TaxID=2633436 RepID=UPI00094A4D74|nr:MULTISPECIES: SDR family oxidoreductase [unclassified Salegentibacter]APS37575.1 short-chain dehydrogenase [Salegentibacter sp. T436]|tara:strand:+ start:271 stop:1017 length:747 start_codon:yes stop_codon:yes gene_type:complete